MSGSRRAEWGRARRTRRLLREDPRAEVGEEVRVGVCVRVGPVEFKLKNAAVCARRRASEGTVAATATTHVRKASYTTDRSAKSVVYKPFSLCMGARSHRERDVSLL